MWFVGVLRDKHDFITEQLLLLWHVIKTYCFFLSALKYPSCKRVLYSLMIQLIVFGSHVKPYCRWGASAVGIHGNTLKVYSATFSETLNF